MTWSTLNLFATMGTAYLSVDCQVKVGLASKVQNKDWGCGSGVRGPAVSPVEPPKASEFIDNE
jgi:hypothetical protein